MTRFVTFILTCLPFSPTLAIRGMTFPSKPVKSVATGCMHATRLILAFLLLFAIFLDPKLSLGGKAIRLALSNKRKDKLIK